MKNLIITLTGKMPLWRTEMIEDTLRFGDCHGRLICPHCEDEESNLHHNIVEIYNREEDAATGTHVSVSGKHIQIDDNIELNPSPRREGIAVSFWCEQCCEASILEIIQHKGMSYMRWYNGKGFGER
jgi:hypothetical protein